jgi:hypothetical protein
MEHCLCWWKEGSYSCSGFCCGLAADCHHHLHPLQLGGGEVTLKGIRSGLLLLPHEGSDVLVLTVGGSEGRDKGEREKWSQRR